MTIRRTPADFRVVEALTSRALSGVRPGWTPATPHALYALTKVSLSTPEAAHKLTLALRGASGPSPRVAWAGLKDKHALTTQHVSARVAGEALAPPMLTGDAPDGQPGAWRAQRLGFIHEPIAARAIACNRFQIVIRDVTPQATGALDAAAAALTRADDPGRWRVLNLFGPQRFGSARHGAGFAGPALLRGDFDAALRLLIATPARKDAGSRRRFTRAAAEAWGRWADMLPALPRCPERRAIEVLAAGGAARDAFAALPHLLQQLALDAWQSWLWNDLARHAAQRLLETPASGPADELELPLPAPSVDLSSLPAALASDYAQRLTHLLAEHGLAQGAALAIPGLRRPRLAVGARALFVHAADAALDPPEPDELARTPGRLRRRVRFELPSAAYATTVLAALGHGIDA